MSPLNFSSKKKRIGPANGPTLKIFVGLLIGALFGLMTYVSIFLFNSPIIQTLLVSPSQVVPAQIYDALYSIAFTFNITQLVFITLGAILGASVAMSRKFALYSTTIFLGALAGLIVYMLGFLIVNGTEGSYIASTILALYSFTPMQIISISVGLIVGISVSKNLWSFGGIMLYTALVAIVLGYILYSFTITLPQVPSQYKLLSIVLFVTELSSLTMVVLYSFYTIDYWTNMGWKRHSRNMRFSENYLPKVAFHVPCYNEPSEVVIDTLKSIKRTDYPKDRYDIMVLDDSTKKECSEPIKKFCKKNDIDYITRPGREGFKAGALNYGLKKTSDDVDLIAVIDADYQIESNYPRDVVGYFINDELGFIQTPQDYRNKYENYLTEQYYYADSYFYRVVMPSRNEGNAIIFAGTMGIVRKEILEDVGGWGEDFICEDAELSVRILHKDYESLYINETYGRGLVPGDYESYKKQLYRWSFGGVKILKSHFWKFIFSKKLSLRQKFDFLVGGVHWFDGIWILIISAIIAWLAVGEIFNLPFVTHHQREIWLIGLVPIFLLMDGISRLYITLKDSMGLTMVETMRVMGTWFAIKFNNTFAAIKSFLGFNLAFIRTEKTHLSRPSKMEALKRSVSINKFESTCFAILVALAVAVVVKTGVEFFLLGNFEITKLLLVFWLLLYAVIFLCAPFYAYKSYRSPSVRVKKYIKSRNPEDIPEEIF